jgi:hypothetical protein
MAIAFLCLPTYSNIWIDRAIAAALPSYLAFSSGSSLTFKSFSISAATKLRIFPVTRTVLPASIPPVAPTTNNSLPPINSSSSSVNAFGVITSATLPLMVTFLSINGAGSSATSPGSGVRVSAIAISTGSN